MTAPARPYQHLRPSWSDAPRRGPQPIGPPQPRGPQPLMAVRGYLRARLDGRYAAVAHLTRAMVIKSLIESALVCPVEDLGGRPVGYTTASWVGFGEALAAVAGALTGLLFVALCQG